MKSLDIRPYCDDCAEFEPRAITGTLFGEDKVLHVNTVITCCHAEKCRRIYENIQGKVRKNADEKTVKIFKLLDLGVEMAEIAQAVGVSPKTVANHRTILRKARRGEPFSDAYIACDAKLIRAVEKYIDREGHDDT